MKPEWKNAFYLYGIRGLQMVFPLFTFPYLARTLNKGNFALVILIQSTAIFASLIIEYGYNYTATRKIATVVGNREEESEVFSITTSCKLFLSLVAIFVIILYNSLAHKFNLSQVFTLILLTVAQGMLPTWYYQGTSKLRIAALSEIASRSLNLALMIFIVRSEQSGIAYLLLLSTISVFSSLYQNVIICRSIGFHVVSLASIVRNLREGFTVFIFRLGSSLYTSGSMVLLGNVIGPSSFAIYAGADRIFRSAAALTGPLGDAFYPKISAAELNDRVEAKRLKRTASLVLFTFSLIIFIPLYFFADFWIVLLLGKKYIESIDVFKILVIDIPLIALGTIVGIFELLPKKLDYYFTVSVLIAGGWSLFSIYLLVPKHGIQFMAYTVVIAEILVILVCVAGLIIDRRKNDQSLLRSGHL